MFSCRSVWADIHRRRRSPRFPHLASWRWSNCPASRLLPSAGPTGLNVQLVNPPWFLQPVNKPVGDHRASALDVEVMFPFEMESVLQALAGRFRDLNPSCFTQRFKPACDIHGLPPKIVGELPAPNDPRDYRPSANPDADPDRRVVFLGELHDPFPHCERQFGDGFDMIGSRKGNAACDHVRVTDGFNFFQAMLFSQQVKCG